jgi:acid phosphatase
MNRNRVLPVLFAIILVSTFCVAQQEQERTTVGKELRFLVISDWGMEAIDDRTEKWPGKVRVAQQLGATADRFKPLFVISCGDNFHGTGVATTTDPLWKVNFEDAYARPSLQIPWFIALGNHDYEGNVDAELEYSRRHSRWVQPNRYFSFTWSLGDSTSALFVVLDSSPFIESYREDPVGSHNVSGQDRMKQRSWCDSVLCSSKAPWKFVVFHHPAYSASSKHGSTPEIQKTFVPMFEKYRVAACFSGHDHDLQHSRPDGSTVEYFGCGGGADPRAVGTATFTKFSKSSLGFAAVSVTREMMRLRFLSDTGAELYHYEIKNPDSTR